MANQNSNRKLISQFNIIVRYDAQNVQILINRLNDENILLKSFRFE